MSEQDKPKRRFWQIHLSTAILLMISAGIAIGISLLPHQVSIPMPRPHPPYIYLEQGWPYRIPTGYSIYHGYYDNGYDISAIHNSNDYRETDFEKQVRSDMFDKLAEKQYSFRWRLLLDFAVNGGIWAVCAIAFEYTIRRREGRKT